MPQSLDPDQRTDFDSWFRRRRQLLNTITGGAAVAEANSTEAVRFGVRRRAILFMQNAWRFRFAGTNEQVKSDIRPLSRGSPIRANVTVSLDYAVSLPPPHRRHRVL